MATLPAFFTMIKEGLLDHDVFSIWLNPDPDHEPAGGLDFGFINPQRYAGPLTWAPVSEKSYALLPSPPALKLGYLVQLLLCSSYVYGELIISLGRLPWGRVICEVHMRLLIMFIPSQGQTTQ